MSFEVVMGWTIMHEISNKYVLIFSCDDNNFATCKVVVKWLRPWLVDMEVRGSIPFCDTMFTT
jgi:hypothetical protein